MRKHHAWYYVSLLTIFLLGLFVLFVVGYSKQLQMAVLVMLSFFYVILGIIHHKMHHTINAMIVIEYIVIATLGISAMLFVLQAVL